MAYQNFIVKIDRRQTRSHDPETDQFAVTSMKIGGDAGTEINSSNLVTSDNTATFTNKTFDVDGTGNSLTNIANANIKALAGIVESKLALDYSTSTLNSGITTNASDISTNAGNISTNSTNISNAQNEIDAIETAMGAVLSAAGAYVAHTTSNYIDGNSTVTEDLLDLDAQIATNAGGISTNAGDISTNAGNISTNSTNISNAQNEIDAIEGAIGAMISAAGAYIAHSGTNFIDGNSSITADLLDLDAAIGDLTFVPSNYSDPATNVVAAHLQAIDTALAAAGGTSFDDATFKIVDSDGDGFGANFDVSAVTTADKTITMPDANVDLGDIATNTSDISTNASDISTNAGNISTNSTNISNLQGALGAASEAAINYTSNNYVTDATDLITAVSALDAQMATLASTISNFEWQPSVKDYVVDNTAAPATEVSGDRYLLSHDGGAPHADYDGASAGSIVEFNGTSWIETVPTTGTFVAADDEANVLYLFGGASWSSKAFESTTASTGLTKSGFDIQLADAVANTGIVVSSGAIAAVYDDSSIGINGSEQLYVKALGITDGMLAGSISDGKLASDYIQTSEVDDSSIEFAGGNLNVKALGITNAMLAGSIEDSKLNQITTANKVAGSAVQLASGGGLEDSTGLKVAAGGITETMLAGTRAYTASGWSGGTGTQAVKGDVGFVDTDGLVKPAGAGTANIYKKRIVVCADATIDNASSGNWYALPTVKIGAASGEAGMTIGEEVYLSSTAGQIEQTITNITAGHAIILMGYATAAADWELIRPEYLGDA